jgi:hypothetical protein
LSTAIVITVAAIGTGQSFKANPRKKSAHSSVSLASPGGFD